MLKIDICLRKLSVVLVEYTYTEPRTTTTLYTWSPVTDRNQTIQLSRLWQGVEKVVILAPVKLRPYGAIQICVLLLLLLLFTDSRESPYGRETAKMWCVCVTRRLVTLDLWAVPFQLWFFSFSYNRDFSVTVSVTVMYFLCFS